MNYIFRRLGPNDNMTDSTAFTLIILISADATEKTIAVVIVISYIDPSLCLPANLYYLYC